MDCLRMKRKSPRELWAQEDDRVAEQEAVLGPAEGEDVDAGVGGQRAERQVEGRGGVGQSGAVDVQVHLVLVGERRPGRRSPPACRRCRARWTARPRRPAAGRRAGRRPRLILAADQAGGELAVGGLDREQLDAGDPLRRAALVDVQVRGRGADDRLVGAGESVDRGDVGAGAVEDQERLGLLAEVLAKALARGGRVVVVAVGDDVAVVGGGDRREDLRDGRRSCCRWRTRADASLTGGVIAAGRSSSRPRRCRRRRSPRRSARRR